MLFAEFWIGCPGFVVVAGGHVGNALALSIMSTAMRCAHTVDGKAVPCSFIICIRLTDELARGES